MPDMYEQIASNKRKSVVLVLLMVFLVGAVGAAVGLLWWNWVFGVAIALGVSLVMVAFSYWAGAGTVLALSRAGELKKSEDPQLYNVVEEMAIAGGMPMPKVYLIRDDAPNAFATGRDPVHAAVAITSGLRQKLSRDELQAVMAHEISHIRHFDIRLAMLIAVLVGVIVMLCDFTWRMAFYSRVGGSSSRRGGSSNDGGGGARVILIVAALVLAIIAPMLAFLIQMAVSRRREYLADAGAAELTRYPDALVRALLKISNDPAKLEGASRATQHMYIVNPLKSLSAGSGLFNTHPPMEDRVKRLRQMSFQED